MAKLIIRNVGIIADADASAIRGDILIEDGRITAVEQPGSAATGARELDASGLIAFPGLVNGHLHSGEHFHKGLIENQPLETFICYVRPPQPLALTPRQIYLRTMIGAMEALLTGTSLIVDDVNQALSEEQYQQILAAYRDIGIRALVGSAMTDIPYYRSVPHFDDLPAEVRAQLEASAAPDAERLLHRARALGTSLHPREHRVGYVLAPSAPQRCTDDFLRATRRIADDLDLPVMIHVHETAVQVNHGRQLYGRSMILHLEQIGFLRPGTSVIHGVWLSPGDIAALARTGSTVQHNPWSNLCLGSGMAPVRRLLEEGVNVSLGSDGSGSTMSLNMLNVMGVGAAAGKLQGEDPSAWLTAAELLRAAPEGGARALGFTDIGAIRPGYRADLLLIDPATPAFTPLGDPVRQLVYGERGSAVHTMIVDGEIVVSSGRLTRVDQSALLAEITETCAALSGSLRTSLGEAERLAAHYERLRQKALQLPLPLDVYPARQGHRT